MLSPGRLKWPGRYARFQYISYCLAVSCACLFALWYLYTTHGAAGRGCVGLRLRLGMAYAQGIEMASYLAVPGTQAPRSVINNIGHSYYSDC